MAENDRDTTAKRTPRAPAGKKAAKKKAAPRKKAATKKVVKKRVAKKQAARSRKKSVARAQAVPTAAFTPRERYEMIAKMAYFKAEKRGFEPGWEQQDWLESERAVDEMSRKERQRS